MSKCTPPPFVKGVKCMALDHCTHVKVLFFMQCDADIYIF